MVPWSHKVARSHVLGIRTWTLLEKPLCLLPAPRPKSHRTAVTEARRGGLGSTEGGACRAVCVTESQKTRKAHTHTPASHAQKTGRDLLPVMLKLWDNAGNTP